MLLSFSTTINKKPTHFPEKILSGFMRNELHPEFVPSVENGVLFNVLKHRNFKEKANYDICSFQDIIRHLPKLHSFRKGDRWRAGLDIHFYINARQSTMYNFAPTIPCVSTQTIHIEQVDDYLNQTIVKVDGRFLTIPEQQQLAWNDGFANLVEFWMYFTKEEDNYQFTGQIVHWTDLKY